MARKARGAAPYGVYHITQTSTKECCLFETHEDRMKFLEILNEAKATFGFRLYAYCLEDQRNYHLVLYAGGNDLGKIMKSINIAYAMYLKLDRPLFKDRYKSVLIKDAVEFERIRSEVICSKVLNSCFNSDTAYCDEGDPFEVDCPSCMKSPVEALERLMRIAEAESMTLDELLKDKERRNALIREFRKSSLLSLKEIGNVFGGMSESTVSKILKFKYRPLETVTHQEREA